MDAVIWENSLHVMPPTYILKCGWRRLYDLSFPYGCHDYADEYANDWGNCLFRAHRSTLEATLWSAHRSAHATSLEAAHWAALETTLGTTHNATLRSAY